MCNVKIPHYHYMFPRAHQLVTCEFFLSSNRLSTNKMLLSGNNNNGEILDSDTTYMLVQGLSSNAAWSPNEDGLRHGHLHWDNTHSEAQNSRGLCTRGVLHCTSPRLESCCCPQANLPSHLEVSILLSRMSPLLATTQSLSKPSPLQHETEESFTHIGPTV